MERKTQNEKWITIKVKTNIWLDVKAKAYKEGRKLNWYVEEALREYLNNGTSIKKD